MSVTVGLPAQAWYDDLCSCLQVDLAAVLDAHGWDGLQAVGAGWRFGLGTVDFEPVEYFHPAGPRAFLRHHPVHVQWHHPEDRVAAHDTILEALSSGIRPIVAVDNYHLPFRPAYRDVHAGHLIVVEGFDPVRESFAVHDPMPPAYRGILPRAILENARESPNPDDGSDPFFAGTSPAWRWLEVRPEGEQPELTWPWLRDVILDNLRDNGLAEFQALLDDLDTEDLHRLYVIGWPAQAEASVHAQFLARAAQRLQRPALAEAARWVDLVASAWTGVRIAAAHAPADPAAGLARVVRNGHTLVRHWQAALQRLETATRGGAR
uniref:Butirosin biosynthesis protein H N-terminal domain-containing protein n=1 Tax=uncultured bacterium esnapd17 TaxID=1366598 RepID=S5UBS5_9BACT|nr:hypothetical protein [uncultured bacterium esnapd17]